MGVITAPLPEEPSFHREWFKVISPKRMYPLTVGLLGNRIVGVYTHFDESINRTQPCLGEEVCFYCSHHKSRRWKGYLACITADTKQPRVVELTEGAARAIVTHSLYANGLRGCTLTLKRHKPHPNAPVFATLKPPIPNTIVPPDFDVLPSLERLWATKPKGTGGDTPPTPRK